MRNGKLIFLKLGGSLITDKSKPMTPHPEVIHRLADEIASAMHENPHNQLLIGHGSGSFGHAVANQYQTQSGGEDQTYWQGFAEVWSAARALNQMVIEALAQSGLPVMAFPPSAGIITHNKKIESWDTGPIKLALSHGLVPVVQGDVTFDNIIGGTILSTEAVFQYLARLLEPQEILITGVEDGVYRHYPIKTQPAHPGTDSQRHAEVIPCITPDNFSQILPGLSTSHAVDVTGGMLAKVEMMINLIKENPNLKIQIFSGVKPNALYQSLNGVPMGTLIANENGSVRDIEPPGRLTPK